MKIKNAIVVFIISTLFFGCSNKNKEIASSSSSSAIISGALVNLDSYSDVTITVVKTSSSLNSLSSEFQIQSALSEAKVERPDSDGKFSFGVEHACYILTIKKDKFRDRAIEHVCVDKDHPINDLGQLGLSIERRFVMTASIDNYVFMAGGYNSESMFSTVDVLDVNTGEIDILQLSKRRARGIGITVGRKVMFAGGESCESERYGNCNMSSLIDIYDIDAKTWSTANLSDAKVDLSAGTTSDGYAIFAGGATAVGASNIVDIYNSHTGQWTTSTLPAARFGISSITVGTKIFFAGGSGPDSSGVTKTTRIDIFEPSTNTWTVKNLSVARRYFPTVQVGNKLLFAGGQENCWPCTASSTVDIYDLVSDSWTTASLSSPRELLVGASYGSIAVFVGGEANGSQGLDIVDIYDSSTNTWTTSTISQARTNIAVSTNGTKAFFIGGNLGSHGFSNVIDVFDFTTKTFTTKLY